MQISYRILVDFRALEEFFFTSEKLNCFARLLFYAILEPTRLYEPGYSFTFHFLYWFHISYTKSSFASSGYKTVIIKFVFYNFLPHNFLLIILLIRCRLYFLLNFSNFQGTLEGTLAEVSVLPVLLNMIKPHQLDKLYL